MPEISLDKFCAQWVEAPGRRSMASRLDANAFEFATQAGAYCTRYFRLAFDLHGLYASERWKPRTSRWGKRFTHPIMNDTGKSREGIKGEAKERSRGKMSFTKEKSFRRAYSYQIETTALSSPEKRKRGKNPHGRGYAAIHNTDPKISPYTVNQYSDRKPVQRQFIGFSDKMDDYIHAQYLPLIFKGFPT